MVVALVLVEDKLSVVEAESLGVLDGEPVGGECLGVEGRIWVAGVELALVVF